MTDTDTAEFIPEIFESKAHVRPLDSFDAADLARMSDVRRELFYGAHKAASECAEVELAARDGDEAIRQAVKDLSDKRKAIESLVPPWTPMDEYRRIVKKIMPPEPSPEAKAAAELAQAQYDTANAALNALRERVKLCHDAIPAARKFAAQAWERYHSHFPPKTSAQVHREMMERETERKRNGTDKPQSQERVLLCDLDRFMSGSKGPLGVRRARQGHRHPDGPSGGPTYGADMLNQTVAAPRDAPWNVKPLGTK
jgi:hypothetical protein